MNINMFNLSYERFNILSNLRPNQIEKVKSECERSSNRYQLIPDDNQ
jgi:hypothetical protein